MFGYCKRRTITRYEKKDRNKKDERLVNIINIILAVTPFIAIFSFRMILKTLKNILHFIPFIIIILNDFGHFDSIKKVYICVIIYAMSMLWFKNAWKLIII